MNYFIFHFLGGSYFFNYFEFLLLSEIQGTICQSQLIFFVDSPFSISVKLKSLSQHHILLYCLAVQVRMIVYLHYKMDLLQQNIESLLIQKLILDTPVCHEEMENYQNFLKRVSEIGYHYIRGYNIFLSDLSKEIGTDL